MNHTDWNVNSLPVINIPGGIIVNFTEGFADMKAAGIITFDDKTIHTSRVSTVSPINYFSFDDL